MKQKTSEATQNETLSIKEKIILLIIFLIVIGFPLYVHMKNPNNIIIEDSIHIVQKNNKNTF